MKFLLPLILLVCLFATCKKEQPAIKLDADYLFIIAYHWTLPQEDLGDALDSWAYRGAGFTEIKKDFTIESVKWKSYGSMDYYSQEVALSDSFKIFINRTINSYSNDSIFDVNHEDIGPFCYSGPTFTLLIKKEGRDICLSGMPLSYPNDLGQLIDSLYYALDVRKMTLMNNQDSIRCRVDAFRKYAIAIEPDYDLPICSTVKFIPPVISTDE